MRGWMIAMVSALALGCGESAPADGGVDAGADAGQERDASASDAGSSESVDASVSVIDAGGDAGTPAPTIDDVLAALETDDADAIDALVHDIAWSAGWPMTDGARWLFVTRWDDAPEPVALVSDVNGWDAAASPATRAASGAHYYALLDESSFAVPAASAKYKWHGAPDVFRAPPESTAYGHDEYGAFGWVAPPTDSPHLERFPDLRSAYLGPPRTLRAYLPAGFVPRSEAAAHARVLLLHDGPNLIDPQAAYGGWRVDETLAASPEYADVVVLAVDNAPDRMDAYTHVPDDIGEGSLVGGRADDYLRLLVDEALPFFRARYGVAAEGRSMTMGGSSLGGLVSLYFAMQRPDLAGCVIAMSPTLGWGAFEPGRMDALITRWSAHSSPAIYLDSGGGGTCADLDGDGVQEDSDDSDNYCVTTQLRDHLDAIGYDFDVDLFHFWEPGATHNEAAWAARMPGALESCASAGWTAP